MRPNRKLPSWKWRVCRTATTTVLLSALLYFTPMPFVLRAPGRATDAQKMLTVRGARVYPSRGEILLTTVIYDRATLLYCLYAALDPYAELLPLSDWDGTSGAMLEAPFDVQMDRSQALAKHAALRQVGYSLAPRARGALVLNLLPRSPARGILRPGDLIVRAADRSIETAGDLTGLMRGWPPGRLLELGVQRKGNLRSLRVRPAPAAEGALIGVQIRTELVAARLPVEIQIEPGNVSGASGGLAFALAIVDILTEEDLTRGYRIAATGTIEPNGTVGPISGAGLKAVAARRAGADLLLCPIQNVAEARGADAALPIVGVADLPEALKVLSELPPQARTALR